MKKLLLTAALTLMGGGWEANAEVLQAGVTHHGNLGYFHTSSITVDWTTWNQHYKQLIDYRVRQLYGYDHYEAWPYVEISVSHTRRINYVSVLVQSRNERLNRAVHQAIREIQPPPFPQGTRATDVLFKLGNQNYIREEKAPYEQY